MTSKSIRADIIKGFNQSRKNALAMIAAKAKEVLPDGWVVNLAVGWGFLVIVDGEKSFDEVSVPKKTPKNIRAFLKECRLFADLYEMENERITNKGVKYPSAKW